MSNAVLLDLQGLCRTITPVAAVFNHVEQALEQSTDNGVRLLTDWGSGAVFGVSTVRGQAGTVAAVLEKQLRDSGDTDDVSHILVHQSQTRMGSTELAYTAVPLKTWRRYQQLAAEHPQLVLIHDWVRTLLQWAKQRELGTGIVLVVQPQGMDVLVMESGQAHALERLGVFQDEADGWTRLAQRVVSMVSEIGNATPGVVALPRPVLLWVCQGAEGGLPQLFKGLAPLVTSEVWADAPDQVLASLPGLQVPVQAMDLVALTSSLPLRQSVSRHVDVAAIWTERWLPRIAQAALALAAVMAVTAGVMHYNTQIDSASLSGEEKKAQSLWQALNSDVQQADQLAASQKNIREWIGKRVSASKLPDMTAVLAHVRRCLPPGIVIDEVGLVVEQDSHLVTVVGHAGVIEDSLRSEGAFAQALQSDGFTLQKRDLLLRDGLPKFKLSMTWSAS
jgi:hypothetical protein